MRGDEVLGNAIDEGDAIDLRSGCRRGGSSVPTDRGDVPYIVDIVEDGGATVVVVDTIGGVAAFGFGTRVFDDFTVKHQLKGHRHDVVEPEPVKAVKKNQQPVEKEVYATLSACEKTNMLQTSKKAMTQVEKFFLKEKLHIKF